MVTLPPPGGMLIVRCLTRRALTTTGSPPRQKEHTHTGRSSGPGVHTRGSASGPSPGDARAGLSDRRFRSPYLGVLKYRRVVRVHPLSFARFTSLPIPPFAGRALPACPCRPFASDARCHNASPSPGTLVTTRYVNCIPVTTARDSPRDDVVDGVARANLWDHTQLRL